MEHTENLIVIGSSRRTKHNTVDAKQIKLALGSLDPNHQFWRGVQALLDEAVEAETDAVTHPSLTDSARQFNAGRLAAIRDISQLLRAEVAEAQSLKVES